MSLLWVGMATSTALAAKPSIAVLGLEVVDPGGTPTPADTEVAKQLTNGLRQRARAGTGIYQYAPGSEKELIDEKLLNNCNSEAISCMSTIGKQVGADRLMYGKIERLSSGYRVTLWLLDVTSGKRDRPLVEQIPFSQATGPDLQVEAKKVYAKLTGETTTGNVVVKVAGADRGTIYIDGEAKGTISSGTGEVSGLSEGQHRLAVEVVGYRRWEKTIQVTGGQATNVPVDDLQKADVVTPPHDGSGGGSGIGSGGGGGSTSTWKAVGWGALAVSAISGGLWAYAYAADVAPYDQSNPGSFTDTPAGADLSKPATFASSDNCSNSALRHGTGTGNQAFDKACSGYSITQVAIPMTIGFGVVGVGALIWAYHSQHAQEHNPSASTMVGHRTRHVKPKFAIIPVMAPNGGGMTFRMDW